MDTDRRRTTGGGGEPLAVEGPPAAASQRRWAIATLATSLALVALTGFLGPSAAQPSLPGRFPVPWQLGLDPSPWLVTALLLAAVGCGAAGLVFGLLAVRAGWRLHPRRAMAAGVLAAAVMVVVPPMGSADVLVYAGYGRIASLGEDPYRMTATDLANTGDPIGRAVEPPWQDAPSIYGPVATGEQWLASRLGGSSVQATVWWLAFFTACAYVVTGVLLLLLAGGRRYARSRVLLLWWLNPLLLYEVVNGAHLDGIGIAFAVAALALLHRSPLAAGLLVGTAVAVKLSFGLYALAFAWSLRRSGRRLILLVVGAFGMFAAAYATVGMHALDQARSASRLVSLAMPARLLVAPLEAVLPNYPARDLIAALSWAAFAALALWLISHPASLSLASELPEASAPSGTAAVVEASGGRRGAGSGDWSSPHENRPASTRMGAVSGWLRRDSGDPRPEAIRVTAIVGLAWLLTATYSLPWYDVVAWAPITLLAGGAYDWLLLARTTVLAVAYLPGRAVELPAVLDMITRNLRGTVGPLTGIALLVLAVIFVRARPAPGQARLMPD